MRHGHGTTSDKPKAKVRRCEQPARDETNREKNRRRAIGGGQPNELGVTQGQNAEQGNTVNPRMAYDRGKVRH
jgi:hypothetical protein